DARLRLPACPVALHAQVDTRWLANERQLVRVSCPGGPRWSVNVTLRVQSELDALALNRALAAGASITPEDVVPTRRVVPGIGSDLVLEEEALRGRRVRRPLPAGTLLSGNHLEVDWALRRGQQVTLIARLTQIEVRSSGIALADARPGERARVRAAGSLKIVEGTAVNGGIVEVFP
ncbi:MAG: flagellar basal body P-ring formation chaperone FlgA, partial [Steroidobacteraceae bacterium]|nr:flagellar basal body P-ring formation chaperone FlgA [Steroidobacteraceae bacterium]